MFTAPISTISISASRRFRSPATATCIRKHITEFHRDGGALHRYSLLMTGRLRIDYGRFHETLEG